MNTEKLISLIGKKLINARKEIDDVLNELKNLKSKNFEVVSSLSSSTTVTSTLSLNCFDDNNGHQESLKNNDKNMAKVSNDGDNVFAVVVDKEKIIDKELKNEKKKVFIENNNVNPNQNINEIIDNKVVNNKIDDKIIDNKKNQNVNNINNNFINNKLIEFNNTNKWIEFSLSHVYSLRNFYIYILIMMK